jgi:hypothetical protein
LVLRYVLAAFRAVQNKKAARVTLRTFYEFQRRYKSNKRKNRVPREGVLRKWNFCPFGVNQLADARLPIRHKLQNGLTHQLY